MEYRVGIDIGSTTVKVVILDQDDKLIFRSYERHYSAVREKTCELLRSVSHILDGQDIKLLITGSAGFGVARACGLDFVQEVYATAAAVNEYEPDTDCVIELGGEDAKIIFFKGSLEERMNGSCAGGTGAFIDQMATLLDVDVKTLDDLSRNYEKIYPIASRCGVFAKTGIQPILNQGGRKEDVAASIFQAVVNQTISGLTQGRELSGKIVFLGGPLFFLKGLRERFVETLNLDSEHAIFPENADCFAAIGASLCAGKYKPIRFDDAIKLLSESVANAVSTDTMPRLFTGKADYDEFIKRHNMNTVKTLNPLEYSGDAYLGIDAGSTTTKLVLISEDGGILYTYYSSNKGNPVAIVEDKLKEIYEILGDRITIKGSAVTGYGEDLIKNAFTVDTGLVETIAHYRAAQHFNEDVDFIIDIGGQDMKCFKIRNKAVDSIMLNEACSSGCGSFIETFAKALDYDVAEFSKLGLFVEHPVNLGSRCTVFMNSSVKQAQKEGASVGDISAGLSISVVKNAIYKVIRASGPDDLGQKIVVQGGTFLNDAVLRSFEMEIGREVIRPTIAGIMGAYGAALYAKDMKLEKSGLITEGELRNFTHTSKPTTCKICLNNCSITINQFQGGRKYISGNRCQRPLGKEASTMPDIFKYKYSKLLSLCSQKGTRGRIGIPFGLNMYENLPFWMKFFDYLGFEVVLSGESSRSLYVKGQHTIPSDTVCYPAKLMHGHIEELLDKKVDAIFYPCMPYNFDEKIVDNHYNCPVVAYYPELLAANVARLSETKYLMPYFGLHRQKDFIKRAAEYFFEQLNVPKDEVVKACELSYTAYREYKEEVNQKAVEMIDYARQNGKKILVIAGRPYHIDPEINHGINDLATSYDFVVISEDSLSHILPKEQRKVLNQWTYQSRMYAAAKYVCSQPDMNLVQLVSFGCGIDAITTDEVRDILENGKKLYTQIKIDDINNLGAVKIRLRSLIAALDAREE